MKLDVKPSLVSVLSADMRARSSFLPFCPTCSHIGVEGFPDMLIGPAHRKITTAPNRHSPSGTVSHAIQACCSLSSTSERFEGPADAAKWWREKRASDLPDIATNERRRNCLRKLESAGLEPILTTSGCNEIKQHES